MDDLTGTPATPGLRRLLVLMRDPVILDRLAALATSLGLELEAAGTGDGAVSADAPLGVVVELELPDAIERIGQWRRRWPDALLAGSIRFPDQERWHGAIAAGADLVANRGALVAQLDRALRIRSDTTHGGAAVPRLPVRLMERAGDGLVGRLPDAPGGSIVLFRIGDRLHAIRDACPHAGASLADGVLDGTVITCPRHGSQFDVTTGSRERGPSDFAIRTYRVVTVEGTTYVEAPE